MESDWNPPGARALINGFADVPGGLLPALHALCETFGYVDDGAIPLLADAFNLSGADVYGVLTFYHDFRRTKPGRHVISVCRGEACQALGAEDLLTDIKRRLNVDLHGTTTDGEFTLEQVFCLGNCALSPSVLIDGKVHGRVTPARFQTLCHKVQQS